MTGSDGTWHSPSCKTAAANACICAGGHEMTSINVLIKINGYYHLLINKKENWPGFDVHK